MCEPAPPSPPATKGKTMFTARKFESLTVAKQPEQEMQLISVTPELAKSWLERNTNNRPLSKWTVTQYANEMNAKTWRHPTGEPLIFDTNGVIQQGQHRLNALVLSGKTIEFWVLFNADPDDFRVIDSGKKRSVRDVIMMQGGKNAAVAAAAARLICLQKVGANGLSWDETKLTRSEIVEFHEAHFEALQAAAKIGKNLTRVVRISPSQFAAVYAHVHIISDEINKLNEFVDDVTNGFMLPKDSAALALRNWSVTPKSRIDTHKQKDGIAVIIKTWNAYNTDSPMRLATWRNKEMFPKPLPSQY